MIVGTLLETLSVGLLVPVLSVLTSTDSNIKFPFGTLHTDFERSAILGLLGLTDSSLLMK